MTTTTTEAEAEAEAEQVEQNEQSCHHRRGRKLRVLVITMGGARQEAIETMFQKYNENAMKKNNIINNNNNNEGTTKDHDIDLDSSSSLLLLFEPPVFCQGVSSRSLRTRSEFFRIAHDAGLVPTIEWEALQQGLANPLYQRYPERLFECLSHIPIVHHHHHHNHHHHNHDEELQTRLGSDADLKVHYSVELWRKCKGLNRGRGVLGCVLAHLIAMKQFVADGTFDVLMEDNVRLCEDAAERIWDAKLASEAATTAVTTAVTTTNGENIHEKHGCHLRYYGWLGSLPNLQWVFQVHSKRKSSRLFENEDSSENDKVFALPIPQDFETTEDTDESNEDHYNSSTEVEPPLSGHTTAGGTPLWGSYAYWISSRGYDTILNRLRRDVGSLVWKGKRMRTYSVKPYDKILQRHVVAAYGPPQVHVSRYPAVFRAPMLTSNIHTQWDPEFCRSTEYQLSQSNLSWEDLILMPVERQVVEHYKATGEWWTVGQMTMGKEAHDEEQRRRAQESY